jgi:putative transcriptional regulator
MPANRHDNSFSNHFLVALNSTGLAKDYFCDTISLLIDHNQEGTFGLVINQPLPLTLADLLPGFEQPINCPVLEGGPVEPERLFFLHSAERQYAGTLNISETIALSTSDDLLADLKSGNTPDHIVAVLGYAGWGPGQLEGELAETIWQLTPTHADIVFTTPFTERRSRATALLGVDINLINPAAGYD